jgi:hypothetical protein
MAAVPKFFGWILPAAAAWAALATAPPITAAANPLNHNPMFFIQSSLPP